MRHGASSLVIVAMEAGVDEGKDEAPGRVDGGAEGRKAGPVVGRWHGIVHCGTIRVGFDVGFGPVRYTSLWSTY